MSRRAAGTSVPASSASRAACRHAAVAPLPRLMTSTRTFTPAAAGRACSAALAQAQLLRTTPFTQLCTAPGCRRFQGLPPHLTRRPLAQGLSPSKCLAPPAPTQNPLCCGPAPAPAACTASSLRRCSCLRGGGWGSSGGLWGGAARAGCGSGVPLPAEPRCFCSPAHLGTALRV
jgi:hypothetical protein